MKDALEWIEGKYIYDVEDFAYLKIGTDYKDHKNWRTPHEVMDEYAKEAVSEKLNRLKEYCDSSAKLYDGNKYINKAYNDVLFFVNELLKENQ